MEGAVAAAQTSRGAAAAASTAAAAAAATAEDLAVKFSAPVAAVAATWPQGHSFEAIDAMWQQQHQQQQQHVEPGGPSSPIIDEAMGNDMLLRIRNALQPFTFGALPGEVYIRRNEIVAQLVHHKGWVSNQDKFEVLALIGNKTK